MLYGGRSSEREVSLRSAKCVIDNLDPERFEVLPVGIDHGSTRTRCARRMKKLGIDWARFRSADDVG